MKEKIIDEIQHKIDYLSTQYRNSTLKTQKEQDTIEAYFDLVTRGKNTLKNMDMNSLNWELQFNTTNSQLRKLCELINLSLKENKKEQEDTQ